MEHGLLQILEFLDLDGHGHWQEKDEQGLHIYSPNLPQRCPIPNLCSCPPLDLHCHLIPQPTLVHTQSLTHAEGIYMSALLWS